jgi:outer membrane lipoprotein-sorting protein
MNNLKKQTMKRVLLLLFILFAGLSTKAQTVDEILNKYLETTGGVQKWKALKTMKATGKMSMQGMDLDFELTSKVPNKQYITILVQGQKIVQAYDGTDAWMLNPFMGGKDPVKIPAEEAKEMTEQELEDEFIDYKKKGHEVKLLGKEEVDGTSCFKIELIKNKNNDKEDVTEIHYFDAENFVPIMTKAYARSGPSKGQEAQTYLSDYQEVNGLMMPFSMETKSNGQTVQKMTFQKVTINENVDDTIFTFPKK